MSQSFGYLKQSTGHETEGDNDEGKYTVEDKSMGGHDGRKESLNDRVVLYLKIIYQSNTV